MFKFGSEVFLFLYRAIIKIVAVVLVICTTALIFVVFGNVVGRYFFNVSLAWAEEASRFLFLWAVFLAAVLAYENYEHMNLDIMVKFFSGRIRRVVIVLSQVVAFLVLLIIFRGGVIATAENLSWLSPALEIPYGYVYSIIPFASLIMLVQTLARLLRNILPAQEES